jgi:hypothetical protein
MLGRTPTHYQNIMKISSENRAFLMNEVRMFITTRLDSRCLEKEMMSNHNLNIFTMATPLHFILIDIARNKVR